HSSLPRDLARAQRRGARKGLEFHGRLLSVLCQVPGLDLARDPARDDEGDREHRRVQGIRRDRGTEVLSIRGRRMMNILISGASIAGPALAWWLSRQGFTPTLVEKAPGPRPGGHAIDVRGAALDVLRAMGLADTAADKRTRMKGVSKLNAEGK